MSREVYLMFLCLGEYLRVRGVRLISAGAKDPQATKGSLVPGVPTLHPEDPRDVPAPLRGIRCGWIRKRQIHKFRLGPRRGVCAVLPKWLDRDERENNMHMSGLRHKNEGRTAPKEENWQEASEKHRRA